MLLFAPLRLRELELKNRIGVSPMCEYSAKDGHPGPWHLVHLGSRAVGGAGLVMTEASAVQAIGRISPPDTGVYDDRHVESWKRIAEFIGEQGAVPGMQLAHAGRKGSTAQPWLGGKKVEVRDGGWVPVAPSTTHGIDGGRDSRSLLAAARSAGTWREAQAAGAVRASLVAGDRAGNF